MSAQLDPQSIMPHKLTRLRSRNRTSGTDDVVVVETSAGMIGISVPLGSSGGEAQVSLGFSGKE